MAKRKAEDAKASHPPQDAESSDEDVDMPDVQDVELEFFDPQEVDFHGIKTLLRQLFDVDRGLQDLSSLTNLILSQPTLGSTVKTPGDEVATNETDPYAFLTVLNLNTHREKPEIQTLITYLESRAASIPSLSKILPQLLDSSSDMQVGLILTERLINMPSEIVPPMYNMLLDEIEWAVDDKEPYIFTHYLVLSKTYTEVTSELDNEDDQPRRKQRKTEKAELFYFHAEDEVLQKHAVGFGSFEYTRATDVGASDARRAFQEAGIRPTGHMILIEAAKFDGAVMAVGQYLQWDQHLHSSRGAK